MKGFGKAVARGDPSLRQWGYIVVLFSLLPSALAQKAQKLISNSASVVQTAGSTPETAKFNDATSTLGINFEYIASHTSKKYLIETMGSGVALFDYDNDGRLDIFVVNGASRRRQVPRIGIGFTIKRAMVLLKT
jgi:hypothetical protein